MRLTPNVPYFSYLPGMESVPGSWIRPEDLHLYEDLADSVEFLDCDIKKEQALYRIYAEDKAWSGGLHYIISNISKDATNRMIPPSFTQNRLNCRQRCQEGGVCRACYHILTLANEEFLKDVKIKNEEN